MNYRSVTSTVTLVDIHPLSCEYGTNILLRIILISMKDLNTLSRLTLERTDILRGPPGKTLYKIRIFSQEMVTFVVLSFRLYGASTLAAE